MRVIMLMYDSLNRHMLEPYGCDWTKTPNFKRLAEKTVTFEQCYAGSLPCMPARRELHTGRYNFLHRSWGPLEPFDDSLPEILRANGVYTHLISDHQHYWEDGGATYHQRYNTWENVRGQEADHWKASVKKTLVPEHLGRLMEQDVINRGYITREEDQPQTKVFDLGLEFLETNKMEDNWFLHVETFDPHEPFYTMEKYKQLYPHEYHGPHFDWPNYTKVTEPREAVEHCRYEYAALLSMCDANLGKILDFMDENDMWKDTMLIVNTDHGFLLGEHDCWAKSVHPFYNENVHIPLFIWNPDKKVKNIRRNALVQTIDIAPTILDAFHIPPANDMQGNSLIKVLEKDDPIRDYCLFGMHGGQVNITDGRYVYMRDYNDENKPLYNYTQMPTHMKNFFSVDEMRTMSIHKGFPFTKGCSVMKIEDLGHGTGDVSLNEKNGNRLYDLEMDPKQENPINDSLIEKRMITNMIQLMIKSEAPKEQYTRLGLEEEYKVIRN